MSYLVSLFLGARHSCGPVDPTPRHLYIHPLLSHLFLRCFKDIISKGKRVENNTIMKVSSKNGDQKNSRRYKLSFSLLSLYQRTSWEESRPPESWCRGWMEAKHRLALRCPKVLEVFALCVCVCVCLHLDCGMPQPLWGCHPPQHRTFYMKRNAAVLV